MKHRSDGYCKSDVLTCMLDVLQIDSLPLPRHTMTICATALPTHTVYVYNGCVTMDQYCSWSDGEGGDDVTKGRTEGRRETE